MLIGLTQMEYLHLAGNEIVDVGPLLQNTGLGAGDQINLQYNPLSQQSIDEHIPALQARSVIVTF